RAEVVLTIGCQSELTPTTATRTLRDRHHLCPPATVHRLQQQGRPARPVLARWKARGGQCLAKVPQVILAAPVDAPPVAVDEGRERSGPPQHGSTGASASTAFWSRTQPMSGRSR